MSVFRMTFEVAVPDTRLEQAKQVMAVEKAVVAFRNNLPTHEYHDAIVTPRGPKASRRSGPAVIEDDERDAAE